MRQQQFFERVVAALESLEIPYMITGSVGAMLYGEPRLTNDMDVVVMMAPHHIQPLTNAFNEPAFYVPPPETILDAIRQRGQFNLIHVDSGSKVDLILRKQTDFALAEFERRRPVVFTEHIESQSATAEDIIVAKLMYLLAKTPRRYRGHAANDGGPTGPRLCGQLGSPTRSGTRMGSGPAAHQSGTRKSRAIERTDLAGTFHASIGLDSERPAVSSRIATRPSRRSPMTSA